MEDYKDFPENRKTALTILIGILILNTILYVATIPMPASARTYTKTIYPEMDAWVWSLYENNNYGSREDLWFGYYYLTTRGEYIYTATYIYFSLHGIPSNAIIISAYLKIVLQDKMDLTTTRTYSIYQVKEQWKENTITYNNRPQIDVTTPYGSIKVSPGDTSGKTYTVDVTDLAKLWVEGTKPNYGLCIGYGLVMWPPPRGAVAIFSKESGSDKTKWPRLVITYKVPSVSISVSPLSASVPQGGSASFQVSVTPSDYTGTITLSASNLPSGASYSFNPPSGSGSFTSILTIATSTMTPPRTYSIRVGATGTGVSDQKTITLTVTVTGTFTLSLNPNSVTIPQGGSASVQVLTTPVGGYSGTVTLFAAGGPTGVSVTFTSTSISAGSSTTLNVEVASTVLVGTYTITIRAVGTGGIVQEVPLQLEVVSPGYFELTLSPASVTVNLGGAASVEVRVVPHGGYDNSVTLSLEEIPSGITATLSTATVTPGGFATLSLEISSTVAPGTYTLKVKGSGEPELEDEVTLIIIVEEVFDFTVSISPPSTSVNQGEAASATITVTLVSGSPRPVSLSLEGLPAGTYSLSPSSVTPTGTSTLTVDTEGLEGTYTLTVKAVCAGVEKTATATLTVEKFDFSLSITPTSIELKQGETATLVVEVELVSGTPQSVTLSLTGLPPEASHSFTPQEVTPPGTSTLTINAGSAKGTFTILVKGSGAGVERTATAVVTIKEKLCVIATATYGSELASEVQFLRSFRDNIVLSTASGSAFYVAFDAFYYSWSPAVASYIHRHPEVKPLFKVALYPLIGSLKIAALTAGPLVSLCPELAVYVAGTIAPLLIGLFYLTPLVYLVFRRSRRRLGRSRNVLLATTVLALTGCLAALTAGVTGVLTAFTAVYVVSLALLAPIQAACYLSHKDK